MTPDAGKYARLTFNSFSTESGYDYLYIYEDNGAGWYSLGTFDGSTSITGVISSTGTTGKIKLNFTSDGGNVSSGFEATMSCYSILPSFQLIQSCSKFSIE